MLVAQEWGRRMKKQFKLEIRKSSRKEVLSLADGKDLTSAIFATFYNDSPYIVTTAVRFDNKGNVTFAITNTFTKPKTVFMGREIIASELFAGQTERAIRWRESLASVLTNDGYALVAIRAVEFSIDNYPLVNRGLHSGSPWRPSRRRQIAPHRGHSMDSEKG
jgi:hypothetical protein